MIRKGNFDFLILDLMLPGIRGMELCRISETTQDSPPSDHHATAKGKRSDRYSALRQELTIT